MKTLYFTLLIVLSNFTPLFAQDNLSQECSIYIHGYTANGENYFGDLPRQIVWDSNQNIDVSAPLLAKEILKQIETCPIESYITLRPHSYGAAQVLYILGQGKRFQDTFPDHDFVQVYKQVIDVISYTGAYHGTPLMDLVCSNKATRAVGKKFGKACVKTLLTSPQYDVASYVNSPGVPTYLIYSTDRSGYYGTTGAIIAKHGVSFWDYFFKGVRNQNDNTLPLSATKACVRNKAIKHKKLKCRSLDANFFQLFMHEENYHHTEFLKNAEYMQVRPEGQSE